MPPDDEVAGAWVHMQENWWAYQLLDKTCESDPEHCWRLILTILAKTDSGVIIETLGAGELEDLLSDHGSAFIDRAEALAAADPKFLHCLSSMWKTKRIPDALWDRIAKATGRESGAA
jgi:hypothetical protein